MGNGDLNKYNEGSKISSHASEDGKPTASDHCPASQKAALRVREYVAPRNEVEADVAEILAEFLQTERIGINDNFLLLGGESLLASQAAWRIRERFGCEVTLRSILAGTVSDIAAEILDARNVL